MTNRDVPPRLESAQAIFTQLDIGAGWPPGFGRAAPRVAVAPSSAPGGPTELAASIAAVINDPDVRRLLAGARWEVLGCHRTHRMGADDGGGVARHRARVCLYDYTRNRLIESHVEDGRVSPPVVREPWQYPEARIEMAQAISMASAHPDLTGRVRGLSAHAILRVPSDPRSPGYRHRCMLVMFTREQDPHEELPVLYSALVDLVAQRVVAWNESPCARGEAARPDTEAGDDVAKGA